MTIYRNGNEYSFCSKPCESMINSRMGHKLFFHENKGYVFGGNDNSEYLNKCEVYDVN